MAQEKPNSNFAGVHIGVITYSFSTYSPNGITAQEIIPTMVKIGLSNCELMWFDAESIAGIPSMPRGLAVGGGATNLAATYPQPLGSDGLTAACEARVQAAIAAAANPSVAGPQRGGGAGFGRNQMTPEQLGIIQSTAQKAKDWRAAATPATWKSVRKQFEDAGIDLRILCYNMGANITDDEIDYAFQMARDLGVQAISSSSIVPVAKRVAPFAEKYKMIWGGHGHDNVSDPNEFAKPQTFAEILSFGPYIGVNLDIGHFVAAGYDPVSYIKENHARITNIHLKDRKKNSDMASVPGGVISNNYPWGQGATPIKEVLILMRKEKYPWPADIEYEYECRASGSPVDEVAKSLAYAKNILLG